MKKLMVIGLIVISLIGIFFLNSKVLAKEGLTAGDMARTGEDDGIMPISEDDGIMPINQEGQTNTTQGNAEIYDGDLYLISGDLDYNIDKVINGNVFVIGKNVKITGQVYGSVFAFADTVIIDENSYIASHLFAFANSLDIKGTVFDVYSSSKNLSVGHDALIYRDIKAGADKVHLAGDIERDANIAANNIDIANDIKIGRNFRYELENEIEGLDKLQIGNVIYKKTIQKAESDPVSSYIVSALGTIVFDVVIYLVLLFIAPKFVERTKEYVSTKGLLAFAIGLAFTVLVPLIAFTLMITGIGAGLGVLLVFIYAAVLMLNACIVSVTANEFLAEKLKLSGDKLKKVLLLIPVSLVIWAARKLPFVGTWASIIVFLLGIGIVTFYQFTKRKEVKE